MDYKIPEWQTLDEITALMRAKGIKGEQRCVWKCPMAQLLTSLWGEAVVAGLDSYLVVRDTLLAEVPNTPLVREWMLAFDDNRWPDLVAPPYTLTRPKPKSYFNR